MRKTLIATTVAAGLLAAVILPTASGAPRVRSLHFTTQVTGAQISATQAVFKVHDSRMGDGAGIQNAKITGVNGTDSEITYYGDASASSKGKFKIGTPNAQNIASVTGSGKDVSGTGKLKGFKSNYTYTGTFNTHTLVYKVTITGTGTLP
jgi:type II secretory pathway pseudopilin PulG